MASEGALPKLPSTSETAGKNDADGPITLEYGPSTHFMSRNEDIEKYGWTAVPRDVHDILHGKSYINPPAPFTVKDAPFPTTDIVQKVQTYVQGQLTEQTYNHSMRVFFYAKAIHRQQFPEWRFTDETLALTCLLHDLAATSENIHKTLLSFEYFGGYLALDLLASKLKAPLAQAESVAEAVIRHQDLGTEGTLTTLTQIIQLATIFDNMGGCSGLVHPDTIKNVVKAYPRKGWSACFAATIREENKAKPWAHTKHLGENAFPEGVANNKLMAPYDA